MSGRFKDFTAEIKPMEWMTNSTVKGETLLALCDHILSDWTEPFQWDFTRVIKMHRTTDNKGEHCKLDDMVSS